MAERTPWWRAFLVKRKSGGLKDAVMTPEFDPFSVKPEKPKEQLSPTSKSSPEPKAPSLAQQGKTEPNKGSSLLSDETYDDTQLDSVFNEQTCRRNMRVSRSGRFKEKRRVRSSLPIEEKDTDKGDQR